MASSLDDIFSLEQLDTNLFRNQHHQENFTGNLFGGQVLAQALLACYNTQNEAPSLRLPHSLHAYFLRPGKSDTPVIYDVEKVRDGRSIVSRRVVARQYGRPIFNMSASFHSPEEGYHHQAPFPSNIPMPEEILSLRKTSAESEQAPIHDAKYDTLTPFQVLTVDPELFKLEQSRPAEAYYWFKARDSLSDSPINHICTLAYASDLGLLATALLPHGVSIYSGTVCPASLDHAMWFHSNTFRADDWLLCHSYSPWAGSARGFAHATVFSKDGSLILSTAQEGLIRPA